MEALVVVLIVSAWAILILPGLLSKKQRKDEYKELSDQMDEIKSRADAMEDRFRKGKMTQDDLKDLEDLDEDRRSLMARFRRLLKRDMR